MKRAIRAACAGLGAAAILGEPSVVQAAAAPDSEGSEFKVLVFTRSAG